MVRDREGWCAAVHDWATEQQQLLIKRYMVDKLMLTHLSRWQALDHLLENTSVCSCLIIATPLSVFSELLWKINTCHCPKFPGYLLWLSASCLELYNILFIIKVWGLDVSLYQYLGLFLSVKPIIWAALKTYSLRTLFTSDKCFTSICLIMLLFWFLLSFRNADCFHNQFSSVQFTHSVVSDSLRPHEPQHARPPCPSPTPGVYPNSYASSRWCHPAISSSVIPFSSCPQSLPASGSFPMSQLFAWGGQSIGVSVSASVLPMNTQDQSPLGWTGWISLQSKGLSRVFTNTTVQKHQFFYAQLSPQSNSQIHTWPLEKL